MKKILFWSAFLLLILTNSCTSDKSKKIPDVSDVKIDWSLVRFESEILALDSVNGMVDASPLFEEYPVFASLYFRDIMGYNLPDDSLKIIAGDLIGQPLYRHWLDTCRQVFKDFSPFEEQLNMSFKYFQYYFPDKQAPRVYTLVSEFSIGNFIFLDEDGKDALGIGLDFAWR